MIQHRAIIGFTGRIGHGKTTAAKYLENRWGFQRVRFAGALKEMMKCIGLTPEEIDGERKEYACDLLCGKTPRWAMQSIGTEWGRQLIGQDLWIRVWQRAVQRIQPGHLIVVDDVRYENEAAAVRQLGGVVIRVARPIQEGTPLHSSEQLDFQTEHSFVAPSIPALTGFLDDILPLYVSQELIDQSWVHAALEGGAQLGDLPEQKRDSSELMLRIIRQSKENGQ